MKRKTNKKLIEIPESELSRISAGWGGGIPLNIAYRASAHSTEDFFRGVLVGLSSMWK